MKNKPLGCQGQRDSPLQYVTSPFRVYAHAPKFGSNPAKQNQKRRTLGNSIERPLFCGGYSQSYLGATFSPADAGGVNRVVGATRAQTSAEQLRRQTIDNVTPRPHRVRQRTHTHQGHSAPRMGLTHVYGCVHTDVHVRYHDRGWVPTPNVRWRMVHDHPCARRVAEG